MKVVAVIQARMGSTRLPGKVMLPLAGEHVLSHDIRRVNAASCVDETVVATSTGKQDDIVKRYASREGATVFRGSENDVLGRMFGAARKTDADVVVRVTADCPLVAPEIIDAVVERLIETDAEYACTTIERTFPRGLGVDAFTMDSFESVEERSDEPHQREHVVPYYHEHNDRFDTEIVTSEDVYTDARYQDRTDLRITLDEADDYEFFRRLYSEMEWDDIIDTRRAIDYIDEHDLDQINSSVQQKTVSNSPDQG